MTKTSGVKVVIARTDADAYSVAFRGQRSESVTKKEVEAQFPGLPPIAVGHELTATWTMTDV